jgi:putative phage-type endonuclease
MPKQIALVQGSQEWLDFRKQGLGASEYPALRGVGYQDKEDLIRSKIGLPTGQVSEFTQKIFAEGHQIEAEVRERLNSEGYRFNPIVCIDSQDERLFASLDGFDPEKNLILEVKSTASKDILADLEAGKVPQVYRYQIEFQLMVTLASHALLVVVDKTSGKEFRKMLSPFIPNWGDMRFDAQCFFKELESRRNQLDTLEYDSDALRLEEVTKQIKALESQVKILEDEKKFLADSLLKRFGSFKVASKRLSIELAERAGSVDYKSIPELAGVDLEKYRKSPTTYIKVTLAKGNQ